MSNRVKSELCISCCDQFRAKFFLFSFPLLLNRHTMSIECSETVNQRLELPFFRVYSDYDFP